MIIPITSMRRRFAGRSFIVPTMSTLVMLLVLTGLGTWQVYRLHWKEGILNRIAIAEAEPPAPLSQDPMPYAKVSVQGRFMFDHTVYFGAEVRDIGAAPMMGFYQIVPLQRDDGPPILVDRGWIPQKREQSLNDPTGVVRVTGYIRPREMQHWFSPVDDAAGGHFYTLDPQTIGSAIGISDLAPFTLVALGDLQAGSYPAPSQYLPRPPNNHLSYVITWYGLAVALVVIFGVWLRRALQS